MGTVLLEVVLALALFAAAAAIIGGGLSSSIDGVERLRLNAHAANLAVSVLSELQMGSKAAGDGREQPFEAPFEFWTWEVVVAPTDNELQKISGLEQVEVIIRHKAPPVEYHLSQTVQLGKTDVIGEFPSAEGSGPTFEGKDQRHATGQ